MPVTVENRRLKRTDRSIFCGEAGNAVFGVPEGMPEVRLTRLPLYTGEEKCKGAAQK